MEWLNRKIGILTWRIRRELTDDSKGGTSSDIKSQEYGNGEWRKGVCGKNDSTKEGAELGMSSSGSSSPKASQRIDVYSESRALPLMITNLL
jgi:hypothetical protein